jgi:hypothetical protein
MSTGQASRASVLTSALLETGVWRKSTAFRQHLQAGIIARVLHASSPATAPMHRRVVHLEFACDPLPGGLEWEACV